MIYALLSGICVCLGLAGGMGASTLLRPLLDAISPLEPGSVSILCTAATLGAALVSAFFALSQPIPLHQDELLFLAIGAGLGGVMGELIGARFFAILPERGALLLQNALFFTLLALPAIYFFRLEQSIAPLAITRLAALPVSLLLGICASFLSFGAVPLTLMAYHLLFGADKDESGIAALTIALCAMVGKMVVLLIRLRLNLPHADMLLWLLPGALLGSLAAMIPGIQKAFKHADRALIDLSLFSCAINIAASFA